MQNNEFLPGQRWICDAEPELGLGTVLESEGRRVTLIFLYSGETRHYATDTAPLTRVRFAAGDTVESDEERKLAVQSVEDSGGLLIYQGEWDDGSAGQLPETRLSPLIRLNKPRERLLSGQIDDNHWFELRRATADALHERAHSALHGLRGARIDLIPHQLYIAREAGSRAAPRVLLADEVGLGKTIEAGLIVHYQLNREMIRRVLVVVPEPLVHQWLVEMLRRFALRFAIIDEARYSAVKSNDSTANPFSDEQLVLCSLDFLCAREDVLADAEAAGWDTLVVDEAHHLDWEENAVSPQYRAIEQLAQQIPSLLLLTATPEQLGPEGHFARLRLLDPDRFSDLARFREESRHFHEIAELAGSIADGTADRATVQALDAATGGTLLDANDRSALADNDPATARRVLDQLIDRHGTGRVMFRNTRNAISGFPARRLHQYELPGGEPGDAMVDWLNRFLRDRYPEKSLLICSSAATVLTLAEQLRVRHGIIAAVFHEDMTLLERDRAAAWFASPEDDCPVLISSEIGSEGRNFQFLHHLILHELPDNPDLLEQRIGRLDRIGQQHTIEIHLPLVPGSREARLARWYHAGLNAFEQTCAIGTLVRDALGDGFAAIDSEDPAALETLIDQTAALALEHTQAMESGRDRLLELNSCRPDVIAPLITALREEERNTRLPAFMRQLFDSFNVDYEEQHGSPAWIVRPGRHMAVTQFPELPDEGATVTFDRDTALTHEDRWFLTWDHPMVAGALDLVMSGTYGQTAFGVMSDPALPPDLVLMTECIYRVQCTSDRHLAPERYLPPETLRIVVDEKSRNLAPVLTSERIAGHLQNADRHQARGFIRQRQSALLKLLEVADRYAERELPALRDKARARVCEELDQAIARLRSLAAVNPLIREDEIEQLEKRREALLEAMNGAVIQLSAVRVLVNIQRPG
ncbi:RNA polymerase-associated protein RapA [Granulosicoccaceae sp. 1_MG-2023]|nr:RNA polymerase-associated protein RapA [Granulosicoccaceae sp. 1_MG-2023]